MSSEFGRGYATCLIQFSFHRPKLAYDEALYRQMAARHPNDGLFTPKAAAEIWANGASDHLYELVKPKQGLAGAEWQAAKRLADRALDIGHGYRESSASTPEECRDLLDETDRLLADIGVASLDEAMAWDANHGLRPDAGRWSCKQPMPVRSLR